MLGVVIIFNFVFEIKYELMFGNTCSWSAFSISSSSFWKKRKKKIYRSKGFHMLREFRSAIYDVLSIMDRLLFWMLVFFLLIYIYIKPMSPQVCRSYESFDYIRYQWGIWCVSTLWWSFWLLLFSVFSWMNLFLFWM